MADQDNKGLTPAAQKVWQTIGVAGAAIAAFYAIAFVAWEIWNQALTHIVNAAGGHLDAIHLTTAGGGVLFVFAFVKLVSVAWGKPEPQPPVTVVNMKQADPPVQILGPQITFEPTPDEVANASG